MTPTLRTLALPIAALAAVVVLASCGGNSMGHNPAEMDGMSSTAAPVAGATPATGDKNEDDTLFATMMIPHHAQAIVMADLALKQGTDTKVTALASRIKAAQGPEIARMSGWLAGWGAPVPAADGSDGSHMSGMGEGTGGMMSAKQMTDLGAAKGPAFDQMWVQMMIAHHEGAVEMARTQLVKGANPEAKQLAQAIIDGQSAEIAEMKSL